MGELLKQFDGSTRNKDAAAPVGSEGALITQKQVAEAARISDHQRVQAVRVANVPAEKFEAAIEKPSGDLYRNNGARLSIASFRKRGGKVFGGSSSRHSTILWASAAEMVPRCCALSNSCCENVVTREQSKKQSCVNAP